jgi:hypothetical protein
MSIKQQVGPNGVLALKKGVIFGSKVCKRRRRTVCKGGHEEEKQASKSRIEFR